MDLESTPMQLFRPTKGHEKLELVPETANALKQITQNINLVSIVGTQRGGKSTLLNLLKKRETAGFGLGHSYDPQTTGLWIWARPHPRVPDMKILLMDTEGLDSPHIPQWYNWTLSAVALLISNYFIYQTKGSIDSNATDRLGAILRVAQQLRGGMDSKTTKPKFLWLIRDQQLQMKLEPKDEMMSKLDSFSKEALSRYFADSDCFPLPRPVDRDELLVDVEKLSFDQLRSEFKEEYAILERKIFTAVGMENLLGGSPLTGTLLASLCEQYSKSISSTMTELSQLPTAREMVIRLQGEKAVKAALQVYETNISESTDKLPMEESELGKLHQQAWDKAVETFKQEANIEKESQLETDLKEPFEQLKKTVALWMPIATKIGQDYLQVNQLVSGSLLQLYKKNFEISKKQCKALLLEAYNDQISSKLETFESVQAFEVAFQKFKDFYSEHPKAVGPGRETVLDEFMKGNQDRPSLELKLLSKSFTEQISSLKLQMEKVEESSKQTVLNVQQEIQRETQALREKIQKTETPLALHEQALETLKNEAKQIDEAAKETKVNLNNLIDRVNKEVLIQLNSTAETTKENKRNVDMLSENQIRFEKSLETHQNEINTLKQSSTQHETLINTHKTEIEKLGQTATSLEQNSKDNAQSIETQRLAVSRQFEDVEQKIQQTSKSIEDIGQDHQSSKNSLQKLQVETEELNQQLSREIHPLKETLEKDQKLILETDTLLKQCQTQLKELEERIDQQSKELEGQIKQTVSSITSGASEEQVKRVENELKDQLKEFSELSASSLLKLQKKLEDAQTQTLEECNKKIKNSGDNQLLYLREQLKTIQTQMEKISQGALSVQNVNKSMDHFRQTLEGVWESMGHLSTRIVKVESQIDLHK